MPRYIHWLLVFMATATLPAAPAKRSAEKPPQVDMLILKARQVTVQIDARGSVGSGVWVDREGYVATCWHVVRDIPSTEEVMVVVGADNHLDLDRGEMSTANLYRVPALVVDHDEISDVAILKVTTSNPFETPLPNIPGALRFLGVGAADLRTVLPEQREMVMLAGYPLGEPYLLVQDGNVSGIGHLPEVGDMNLPDFVKLARIFVSVVSNPGNSGGPVLNSKGEVVGLLSGNLRSPMKDELGRPVFYLRAKRDPHGNVLNDAQGQPQFEEAQLMQNSGISVVVPSHFVKAVLARARTAHR